MEIEEQMVTLPTLANLFNLTPRRIQQLTFEGLPKKGRTKYPIVPCIKWYIEYLKMIAKADTREGIKSKEKLLELKAEKESIELKKLQNEVIEIEEVCQSVMEITNVLKSNFIGMPGRIAPQLENKSIAEMKQIIDEEVRTNLNAASRQLEELSKKEEEN